MNNRVKEFLETKKADEKKRYEKEKQKILIKLGLFEKEYAPLVGYGRIEGEKNVAKFPIRNQNVKIGDTIKISLNGNTVDVRIDKIESECGDNFASYEWDSESSTNRYYKKVPIEITDDEYEEVKKYSDLKNNDNDKNPIATILKVIAVIVYIAGFIASFFLGVDRYGDISAMVMVWWIVFFISGTIYLGFAEIIQLLDDIKKK